MASARNMTTLEIAIKATGEGAMMSNKTCKVDASGSICPTEVKKWPRYEFPGIHSILNT